MSQRKTVRTLQRARDEGAPTTQGHRRRVRRQPRSSSTSASIEGQRSRGALARPLAIACHRGRGRSRISIGGSTSAKVIRSLSSMKLAPENGRRPNSASNSATQKLN